eukprot:11268151-Prorocentrum_lima.AAC.1
MAVPFVMHRMGREPWLCPCGCSGPLQAARLEAHGAFTVLVPRRSDQPTPHEMVALPACGEVAALLGF